MNFSEPGQQAGGCGATWAGWVALQEGDFREQLLSSWEGLMMSKPRDTIKPGLVYPRRRQVHSLIKPLTFNEIQNCVCFTIMMCIRLIICMVACSTENMKIAMEVFNLHVSPAFSDMLCFPCVCFPHGSF